jgi:hypothetical protein
LPQLQLQDLNAVVQRFSTDTIPVHNVLSYDHVNLINIFKHI